MKGEAKKEDKGMNKMISIQEHEKQIENLKHNTKIMFGIIMAELTPIQTKKVEKKLKKLIDEQGLEIDLTERRTDENSKRRSYVG